MIVICIYEVICREVAKKCLFYVQAKIEVQNISLMKQMDQNEANMFMYIILINLKVLRRVQKRLWVFFKIYYDPSARDLQSSQHSGVYSHSILLVGYFQIGISFFFHITHKDFSKKSTHLQILKILFERPLAAQSCEGRLLKTIVLFLLFQMSCHYIGIIIVRQ